MSLPLLDRALPPVIEEMRAEERFSHESAVKRPRRGLIHVYTGDGKGKTTAAIGMALRAAGQNIQVYIVQFMKGGHYTGELLAAERFLQGRITFRQFGRGCIRENKQTQLAAFDKLGPSMRFELVRDDEPCGECRYCFVNDKIQKEFCEDAAVLAKRVVASGEYGLVVMDELCYAVHYGMLPLSRALELIDAKHPSVELIVTGGNAPVEIVEKADLVTHMTRVKHYYDDQGVVARRGVEY
jgi:cob(I)alamin adenosyltransferase